VSQDVIPSPTALPPRRELTTKPRFSDKVFRAIVTSGGLSSLILLGLIFAFLAYQGFSILQWEKFHFITTSQWQVVLNDAGEIDKTNTSFGIAAMLVGTIVCAVIALVVAVPVSVLAALFLTFYAPSALKRFLVAIIDLMAAFPSILFWLVGLLYPDAQCRILGKTPP
jgi:phosphate transport system permease protein